VARDCNEDEPRSSRQLGERIAAPELAEGEAERISIHLSSSLARRRRIWKGDGRFLAGDFGCRMLHAGRTEVM
jgi:hypothetical protein